MLPKLEGQSHWEKTDTVSVGTEGGGGGVGGVV